MRGGQPFFTIGVPTYNRRDLLGETLDSILAQDFTDFEVIVGNDYTSELLTGELLGRTDPRIRYVNHARNLREVGNMNALLGLASGRYFTWLFDDDLFEPDFLQTAHDSLVRTGFPPALFPSFRMLRVGEPFRPRRFGACNLAEYSGREFLRHYSASHPEIGSTCGLFDSAALRSVVGGVEELCDSAIGIYCEYLFLVKVALFDRIVYLDAPFYLYRRHAESWSESNMELGTHLAAGRELVRRCAEVLRRPSLVRDFSDNLLKICKIHIITFAYKSARLEFCSTRSAVPALGRALMGHRRESCATKQMFIDQGGETGWRTRLAFLKVSMFSSYLILRLFANWYYRTHCKSKRPRG